MRKLLAYYVASLALLLICAIGIARIRAPWFGDFQLCYAEHIVESPPKMVIFGPSYAAHVPVGDDTHNLGVRGSRSKEHLEMLRVIHADSRPIYVCSIREILFADSPMRPEFVSPSRHAFMSFRHSLLRSKNKPTVSDKRLTRKLLTAGAKINSPSGLEHFDTIRLLRPDTLFVLTPIRASDKRIVELQLVLERKMSEQNFNILNLTNLIDSNQFESTLHVLPEFRAPIIEAVHATIFSEQSPEFVPASRL